MACRYERAGHAANRALEHARRSGDLRLQAGALLTLIAAQVLGFTTPDEGLRTLDGLSDDLSRSRLVESFVLLGRGYYAAMEGSFDEARQLSGLGGDIAEALGARLTGAAAAGQLGQLELFAGDAEAAERAFRRHYEILDEMGDEGHKSTGAANLARALCVLGRFDEAERYAEIALSVAAKDDLASQTTGRSAQALVLAARGEFAGAEPLAREAVRMFADAESPNSQGDVWMDLAQVLRMAGKPAEAEQAAREALALYERKGNRPASESARKFIDELGPSLA